MEALVIALREGMEAALVVGLILSYLRRTGHSSLNRYVYAGIGLAVLASAAGAAVFRLIGLDPENEVLEGTTLAVAAVLVATLVLWMQRTSRRMGHYIETRIGSLAARSEGRAGWGLLVFTFFMVLREGIEMVLFLAAASLTSADGVLQAIGAATGLGLAVVFGLLLMQGSLRLDLRRFFGITSLVLMVLVARLLAGSIHEFSEIGLLPSTEAELRIVGFLVKDSTSLVILMVLVLLPGLAMLPGLRQLEDRGPLPSGEGAVERRKRMAAQRQARRWQIAAISLTLAIVIPLAWAAYAAEANAYRPTPHEVVPQGTEVRMAADLLEPGMLHKFVHHAAGGDVRFMIVKRDENDFAVALDVCNICPAVGYHQEGDTLICGNCNAPINLGSAGMSGGCNPIPLAFSLDGQEVSVAVSDLEAAQSRFAR